MTGVASRLGWLAGPEQMGRQVSGPGRFLFLFVSIFLFFISVLTLVFKPIQVGCFWKIFVGANYIITEPHLKFQNFRAINIFIWFICSNSNRYCVNSNTKNVLEKYASSLDMVFTFFHKSWTFLQTNLGSLKIFLSWTYLHCFGARGLTNPHFKFIWRLNMMLTRLASLELTRTRDVTTHPH